MKLFLDTNLTPFFPAALQSALGMLTWKEGEFSGKRDAVLLTPELNVHRTPSHWAILRKLGVSVIFVSLPPEGVWFLDEAAIRQKRWEDVLRKCNRQETRPFAFRCDLNGTRLKAL